MSEAALESLSREEKLALLARLAREKREAAAGAGAYPLSFAQQRFWFLDQLEPGTYVNNMFRAWWLSGPLDAGALGGAFAELVRRHSTLRTRFPVADGEPRQLVEPPAAAADAREVLAIEDLRGVPEAERRRAAVERAEAVARTPFDLAAGPVFSAVLLVLGEGEHALLFGLHHIAGDGWSLNLLVGELATLYNALLAGEAPLLPPLTVTFGEHARWQRERLAGDALSGELAFWRERLEGAPPVLELPTDHPRRPVASPRGDMLWFDLDGQAVTGLRAVAQEGKATLFMSLFAVFQVFLWRYSSQRDFVVGLPVANRNRTELEGVVGCFANTLLARCQVAPGDAFTGLLAAVRAEALAVFAHSDLPFEKLVEDLQPERNLSANPLFQVMFVLQTQGRPKTALSGIEGAPMSIERGLSKLDLSLDMVEVEQGMAAFFEFSTDLFEASTIERMVGHFRNLAAGAAADPGRPLRELPLLSTGEREHLLGLSQGAGAFPPPVPGLVAEQARRTPGAPAVLFGAEVLTYAELVARANRLARVLRRLGVGPDVPVGVCVERSAEMPLALLAVLRSGGAWVPMDPLYPEERLALLMRDTGMPVVLTQERLLPVLPASADGPRVVVLDTVDLRGEDPAEPEWEIHPESLAYVIYTSGSTGKPKGVGVPHRSLANHAAACARRYGLGPADRCLQFTSISFDITSEEIFPTWLTGGAVVPRAPGLFPSLSELAALIERHGVTVANLPTAYWHEWTGEMHRGGAVPPPTLRLVVVGTEQALPERLAEWLEVVGTRVAFNNSFASTEATVTALVYEPTLEALPRARAGHRVPVGRTIANCCAYVLDADLQPVPVGVPGDVYIGGPNVSRGYLNWPDKTAASYLPDPFAAALGYGAGCRMYRQGDRGRWLASGDLELLGRADDQVKIRGFRIEPGEVETALARHPAVRDGVVLVKSDPAKGRLLVGFLTLVPGAVAVAEELRDWLRGILPDHMVPAALVILDHLPLTHNGKVDRRALLAIEIADDASSGAVYEEAPESPVADVIAGIWATLLSRERVGLHESFFDLGGHSLLAIQVVSRIREALDVEVPLRTIFEKPTVAGVAATVEALRRSAAGLVAPPVVPVPRGGHLVCSFAQQRLWVLDKLLPGDPAYNTPVAVRLEGASDLPTLRTAVGELIRRHEALRTVFAADDDGQPYQVIVPASSPPPALPVIDLTSLAPAAREGEALARLLAESVLPFDLAKGPLLRVYAFRLATAPQDDLLLYLNVHHIVSDGVSITLFLRELVALYTALARGQASPLAELPVQYADFAAWQRSWLSGEGLTRQVEYWRRQLAGAPVVLELPTDRPRPAVQTSRGARWYVSVPAQLTRQVQTLGRERRATLFMTLQAAFAALLGRYSNQDDVLVGWPIAGRSRAELEGVFGFLANILVLRTRLGGEPDFTALLAAVREAALGAYSHQDLPFEQLVEELRPERHLSHNPIFQVFFVLHPPAAPASPAGSAPSERKLKVSVPSLDNHTTRGDLLLALSEAQGELRGFFEYNTDLFDEATIVRLAGHFNNLLQAVVAHPETAVAALPLLATDERRELLVAINATAAAVAPATVHQLFEARAAALPEAPALLFWEGGAGEALTYGELNRRANRLAHRLRAEGVGAGAHVGLCLERSPEMVVALLAVLKAGGAYVPLDPAYPAERIAYVLADCGARVLLTQPELRYSLPDHGLHVVEVEPGGEAFGEESAEDPAPLATAEDLAYVIYTSGSTGKPKGVEVHHRGVVNFLATMAREPGLTAEDALLAVTTISFDIAALELYLPLSVGGKVVLAGRDTASDGGLLKAALAESGATVMQATPATWRLLLAAGWQGAPGLAVLCGGEALPRDLAQELLPRVGSLWNVYGPTETTIWSTVERVDLTGWPFGSMPIGRPIANTRVYLLDRHGEPVPPGVGGELLIGGDGVARGYLGRPELTAERFVPDPWGPAGSRLYRTGDVARLAPAGKLVYLGRGDHQVKVRGYRIELGEIEAVLGRHPAVAACACSVREETPGNPQLIAYFVAAPGQAASVGNLRAALREELPDYMIPGLFVPLAALPLTPNGKVDRKALPAPEGEALARREYVAPEGPVQEKLAVIWAEVLKVPKVGAQDNFFELGGHSLLATSVLSRVAQAFGVELPLRAMFDHPTIAGLSEMLIERELAGADSDLLAQLLADLEGEPSFP